MNIEVIDLENGEQRVLIIFNPELDVSENKEIDVYLQSNSLEPKRTYQETREGKEYNIYYFGNCYLDGHLENLTAISNK